MNIRRLGELTDAYMLVDQIKEKGIISEAELTKAKQNLKAEIKKELGL